MFTEISLFGGQLTNPAASCAVVRSVSLGQDLALEERTVRSAVLTGREWTLNSTDQAGTSWSNSKLVFTAQVDTADGGLSVEGRFDWVANGVLVGYEQFRGNLSADRGLTLQGFQVTHVGGPLITTATYTARLSADGNAFTDGVWFGPNTIPGTWSAAAPDFRPAAPTLRVIEGNPPPNAPQQQTFRITTADTLEVRMPRLTLKLDNLPLGVVPSSLVVSWLVRVQYRPGADAPPGAKGLPGFSFSTTRLGSEYQPDWPAIRGGDLDVTAIFSFGGKWYTVSSEDQASTKRVQILGSNPTKGQVQAYLNSARPPVTWPANSGYDYHSILRKIAYHETDVASMGPGGYNQFYRAGQYAGHPTWNTGGDGGVGVMQYTPRTLDPATAWDWRANVAAGIREFNDKLRVAATYPRTIQNSTEFKEAVAALNRDREAVGLDPLVRVVVPAWTPEQRVLVAIRAYNGAGGTDSIGRRILNEYELATTGVGTARRLVVRVDEVNRVGVATWVRVPVSRRSAGQPHYVQLVLNSPDT